MGIRGLTCYLNEFHRRDTYFRNFQLCNTYVVIDGYAVMSYIFYSKRCDGFFGGDYAEYAEYVDEFFEALKICQIEPLVVIDGCSESKKVDTAIQRTKARYQNAATSLPNSTKQILPILVSDLFKRILLKRGVRCVNSLYEADDQIASLAKILDCPVISNDSDFFIYNVKYIPVETLDKNIYADIENSLYIGCKLFKSEYFSVAFPGINVNVLPLAAVLIGNDYVKQETFKNFLSTLGLYGYQPSYRKIETIFQWLRRQTLDSGITRIVNDFNPNQRQSMLNIIEKVVNGYINIKPTLLEPLGFSPEEIEIRMQNVTCDTYKFQNKNLDMCGGELEIHNSIELEDNCDLDKILPHWFKQEYTACKLSSFFLEILCQNTLHMFEQIEDLLYPPCCNISLRILSIIHKLLHSGTTNSASFKYMVRKVNRVAGIARFDDISIEILQTNCEDYEITCAIPTLDQLRDLDLFERKMILISTLNIDYDLIEEFPSQWRLYIANIQYWSNEADGVFVTKLHLYALILSMLYHVTLNVLVNPHYHDNFSLDTLINEVISRDECEQIHQTFFHKYVNLNKKKTYNRTIIHAFSLLQNCVKSSTCLNALLGDPYAPIDMSGLYAGTLIYNLYNLLSEQSDMDGYLNDVFSQNVNVWTVFQLVSAKILKICPRIRSD